MTRCRSCNADLLWGLTVKGRRLPLNATPTEDGTVVLAEEGPGTYEKPTRCHVLGAGASSDLPRYTSHFATCTDAARYRHHR